VAFSLRCRCGRSCSSFDGLTFSPFVSFSSVPFFPQNFSCTLFLLTFIPFLPIFYPLLQRFSPLCMKPRGSLFFFSHARPVSFSSSVFPLCSPSCSVCACPLFQNPLPCPSFPPCLHLFFFVFSRLAFWLSRPCFFCATGDRLPLFGKMLRPPPCPPRLRVTPFLGLEVIVPDFLAALCSFSSAPTALFPLLPPPPLFFVRPRGDYGFFFCATAYSATSAFLSLALVLGPQHALFSTFSCPRLFLSDTVLFSASLATSSSRSFALRLALAFGATLRPPLFYFRTALSLHALFSPTNPPPQVPSSPSS